MDSIEQNTLKTLETFAQDVLQLTVQLMELKYHEKVTAETRMVQKTNGEKLGITFNFDDNGGRISPTIYPEAAYKEYQDGHLTIEKVAEKMCDDVYRAHMQSPELPTLTLDEARQHVTLCLVNTELNQDLLTRVPHFEVCSGELSAIPRWYLQNDGETQASFVVTNDLCSQHLQCTPDEILQIGQEHIRDQHFSVKTMEQMLTEMLGRDVAEVMPFDHQGPQMLVVTSDNMTQGSAALLSEETLKRVHEILGGEYVVLPSSIHEVICLPITPDMRPDDLRAMVQSVNSEQVAPEERLSDGIFKYDGKRLSLVGESFTLDTPKLDAGPEIDKPSLRLSM